MIVSKLYFMHTINMIRSINRIFSKMAAISCPASQFFNLTDKENDIFNQLAYVV